MDPKSDSQSDSDCRTFHTAISVPKEGTTPDGSRWSEPEKIIKSKKKSK